MSRLETAWAVVIAGGVRSPGDMGQAKSKVNDPEFQESKLAALEGISQQDPL